MGKKQNRVTSALIGVGFDHSDQHKRITQSEQFLVVGGSQTTHEKMTETLVKTFEHLKRKGKTLEQTDRAELAEIIHKNTP